MSTIKLCCYKDKRNNQEGHEELSFSDYPYDTKVFHFENSRKDIADFICKEIGKKVRLKCDDEGKCLEIWSTKPCHQVGAKCLFKRAILTLSSGSAYELKIFENVLTETIKGRI